MAAELRLVELATATHTGRVRDHNEDRALAADHLIAVADGMGGAKAGEVAAQMAIDHLEEVGGRRDEGALRVAVEAANRAIHQSARSDPERAGMGTTITAARLHDGVVDLAHVGDSRAYLWRDGGLRRLTDDHSIVGEMVRDGQLSEEDAESHPHRNVITRALGAEPAIRVDTPSESLADGDVLMLCSDGLTSQVRDEEIAAVLADAPTLQEAAERLVELANAAGGLDNVTVVLARAGSEVAAGAGDGPATAPIRLPVDRVAATPDGRPPRGVLTPVPRRHHGLRPLVVAVVVVALLIAGGLSWLWSRTFAVDGRDGRVAVARGFPVEIGGLDLQTTWQDTGLNAGTVAAAEPDALGSSALGRGEAVLRATRLVWTYGVPSPVVIEAPPPETPAQPSAGASP